MARVPVNLTWRYYFDYVTAAAGAEHTFMVRPDSSVGSDSTAVQAAVLGYLQAAGQTFFRVGWRIIRARRAEPNSDITTPVALTTQLSSFAGTVGTTYTADREAWEWRFIARSPSSGRRSALSLFGFHPNVSSPVWRVTIQTATWGTVVANVTTYLNGSANNFFRAVDGSALAWYPYANLGVNGYWTRRTRIS